jgi:GntR family transcriptional regulator, transcriptional repressor for pyruvate dehydrogenase complex
MSVEIFKPIRHSRTADDVVSQIEERILEGILRVGDQLPGERELALQFEVSRPILRDALKELEDKGLIITRHGGGTYIADIIGQVFSKPVVDLIGSHPKATFDYLEYRREIEALAAGYAATRATADDRIMLQSIIDKMEAAHKIERFDEEARIDLEFHYAIGECAYNIILLHTLRSCYRLHEEGVFYNRSLIYSFPGARDALLVQHKLLAQAIIAGDADLARLRATEHINFVETCMSAAQRSGEWQRLSTMRLQQRNNSRRPSSQKKASQA